MCICTPGIRSPFCNKCQPTPAFQEVPPAIDYRQEYFKLLAAIGSVYNMCIGNVTMSIPIDAEEVGRLLHHYTGMTSIEVHTKLLDESKRVVAERTPFKEVSTPNLITESSHPTPKESDGLKAFLEDMLGRLRIISIPDGVELSLIERNGVFYFYPSIHKDIPFSVEEWLENLLPKLQSLSTRSGVDLKLVNITGTFYYYPELPAEQPISK